MLPVLIIIIVLVCACPILLYINKKEKERVKTDYAKKRMAYLKSQFESLPSYSYEFDIEKHNNFDGDPFKLQFLVINDSEYSLSKEEVMFRTEMVASITCGQKHAEYVLSHQRLIPKKMRGKKIFFMGTIWRDVQELLYGYPDKISGPKVRVPVLEYTPAGWNMYFSELNSTINKYAVIVTFKK